MADELLLEMRDIVKVFPGVRALDGARLSLRRGTVHALMGENGAGKSSLMKCLFGIYRKDSGEILLSGKSVNFKSSKEALAAGVAMVHQELNQAEDRSVADNIWLGRYPKSGPFVAEKRMIEKTREVFEDLGIKTDPKATVATLSVAQRQMVEIAKAVSYNASVIIFDEPTSSLNEHEAERLFAIIEKLKRRGCGIVYISHKMEEILRISDEVTVMRDGKYVTTEKAKDLTVEKIIKLMVGRELKNRFPERKKKQGGELLSVNGLSNAASGLRDVSFHLSSGEILGVAGLEGSGRTELLETLFGLSGKSGGEIKLSGRKISANSPREAKRLGFALVTEERRRTGIFGMHGIRENATVSSLDDCKSFGVFLSDKKISEKTADVIKRLNVKTPSQKTKIQTLSGGNQQKVIFGRWLLTSPQVLLLDEPTRGIDVGAKYEIYRVIGDIAESGKGIIMVSSEMAELLGVCDRILVMSGKRLAGELSAEEATQEKIMALAAKYV